MSKSGWKYYKIKEIGRVVTGKTPPTKESKYFGKDKLFIRIPDMGRNVRVKESEMMLSDEGFEYLRSCSLPRGAVMISCIATVGKVGITDQECCTNQQINSVIPDTDLAIPEWIYYYLKNNTDYLESLGGGGSVYTNISKSRFEESQIEIPPLPEQRAIAHILGTLDDKIELNRKMNETLEAMARAIFKSWFIDFDPVHAKAQGRDPKLPKEISDLFPSEFQNSELGKIPKNWKVIKLQDINIFVVDNRGKTPPIVKHNKNVIPLVEVNAIAGSNRTIDLHQCKKFVNQETYNNWFRKGHPKPGDVLISTVGSIGQLAQVFDEQICIAQNIVALRTEGSNRYLYDLLKSIQQNIVSLDISSVQPSIKVPHLLSIKIISPTHRIIEHFEKETISIVSKIRYNASQSLDLASIRDTLLPKLLSGEIRVKDAEKHI